MTGKNYYFHSAPLKKIGKLENLKTINFRKSFRNIKIDGMLKMILNV